MSETDNCIQILSQAAKSVTKLQADLAQYRQRMQAIQKGRRQHARPDESAYDSSGGANCELETARREETQFQRKLQKAQEDLKSARRIATELIRRFKQEQGDYRNNAQEYISVAAKVKTSGAAQDLEGGATIATTEARQRADCIRRLLQALGSTSLTDDVASSDSLEAKVGADGSGRGPSDQGWLDGKVGLAGNGADASEGMPYLGILEVACLRYAPKLDAQKAKEKQQLEVLEAEYRRRQMERRAAYYMSKQGLEASRPYGTYTTHSNSNQGYARYSDWFLC